MGKTIRRDTLLKMIKRGELLGKCNGHYTDDYWWDLQSNFGKTPYQPIEIYESEYVYTPGVLSLKESYFKEPKGASCWANEDGTITLYIYAGLSYDFVKGAFK